MRILSFLLTLSLTIGLLYFLNKPFVSSEGTKIPALGSFFSPSEGFWQNADPLANIPLSTKAILLNGLQDSVQVSFDERAIPHIFAKNEIDAARVQGYLTAKDRLWQMDITARKMSGRLSEVLGDKLLDLDRITRRKGFVWAAERDVEGWAAYKDEFALLQAYADGVNDYIAELKPKDYPIEFKLMGYAPEAWSPLKTAFVIEGMAESLCFRATDVEATATMEALGNARFNDLFPEWNPKQRPIVEDFGQWNGIRKNEKSTAKSTNAKLSLNDQGKKHNLDLLEGTKGSISVWDNPGWTLSEEDKTYVTGSNNWAVNGLKTASGKPILCNDPHLNLTLPSVWYQVQLHTPNMNAYGVSLPGVPSIIIGFNEKIAWGVTNVGQDVLDWYKITWTDDKKETYKYGSETKKVEYRTEKIYVAGLEEPIIDSVKYTVWGPVVYDDPSHPYADLAMRWVAEDVPTSNEMAAFTDLTKAKSVDDYDTALQNYAAPAQNFVFASQNGDIAIRPNGHLPIKTKEQGRFVQDGSTPETAWSGFIPFANLPFWKNPSRGFVFSANQHSASPSYPYYFNGGFDDSRGRRIYDRLSTLKNADADSMKTMQLDNYSTLAADGLTGLLKCIEEDSLNAAEKELLEFVRPWDAVYTKDSEAATFFEMWYEKVYNSTFDEIFVEMKSDQKLLPENWVLNDFLTKRPTSQWFDVLKTTNVKETAPSIVTAAFKQTCVESAKLKVTNGLRWGAYKNLEIKHLGRIAGFGHKKLEMDGCRDAPNAISETHGPSWRVIVSLDSTVTAMGVYPGGQSGNPGSRHYDDMLDAWVKGEYFPLQFLKAPEGPVLVFAKGK